MKFLLFGYSRLGQDVFCHVIDQTALMFLLALIQERLCLCSSFPPSSVLISYCLTFHNINCGLFEFLSCSRELCHQLQRAGDCNFSVYPHIINRLVWEIRKITFQLFNFVYFMNRSVLYWCSGSMITLCQIRRLTSWSFW